MRRAEDHPFFDGLTPPLNIAHRGAAALYPENTVLAFQASARDHGCPMVETDVQLTRDGRVVVCHDPDVDRCTDGTGRIDEMTLAELQALDAGYRFTTDGGQSFPHRGQGLVVPTLREALEACPTLRFNIDLKPADPTAAGPLWEAVRSAGAEKRVCLGSEHDDVAEAISAEAGDALLFYPRGALAELIANVQAELAPTADVPWRVIATPLTWAGITLVTPALLEAARALGRFVVVWTINEESELDALVELGVGGIITDRPDLLAARLG